MSASQPPYTTLISVAQLQALHTSGAPLMVFDCSFDLMQPAAGRALFEDSHIAGAVFAETLEELNDIDPILNGVEDMRARASLIARRLPDEPDGTQAYQFDIVLRGRNATPMENT